MTREEAIYQMIHELTYLQLKIQNESDKIPYDEEKTVQFKLGQGNAYDMCKYLIQERINALKADRSEKV